MAGDEGRPPFARVVAALRVLHLDDIGAEIGEQLPGPGTGEDAGEFDDADAVKGRIGHGAPQIISAVIFNQAPLYQESGFPATSLRWASCRYSFRQHALQPAGEICHDDVPVHLVEAFVAGLGINR